MVKINILIGSLSGPNFAIWTAKMDRSQTDFIYMYLCFWKDILKETLLCCLMKYSGRTSAKMM